MVLLSAFWSWAGIRMLTMSSLSLMSSRERDMSLLPLMSSRKRDADGQIRLERLGVNRKESGTEQRRVVVR
jgi:hypothetical protein